MDSDAVDWEDPPRPGGAASGKPVRVHVSLELIKISEIDSIKSTTAVDLDVLLFWCDPRIAALYARRQGEMNDNDVPAGLWRPSVDLIQRCADVPTEALWDPQSRAQEVELVDPQSGVLQLTLSIVGQVNNPMDLREFPFDEDTIHLTFAGTRLRDGRTADASDFVLVPCDEKRGRLGYPLLTATTDVDSIPDFDILGTTMRSYVKHRRNVAKRERGASADGGGGGGAQGPARKHTVCGYDRGWSYLDIGVVVRRCYSYYMWKVVFLLHLVCGLSMCVFGFDPCDYGDRTETTLTTFLAAAATLYVVGDKLPPVGFLTPIDRLIIATLLLLFAVQMECLYLKQEVCDEGDNQLGDATRIDRAFFFTVLTSYLGYNIWLFGPRAFRIWHAGNTPLLRLPEQSFRQWERIKRIDHSSPDDVRLGEGVTLEKWGSGMLYDLDGDGEPDAVDLDGDGKIDAMLVHNYDNPLGDPDRRPLRQAAAAATPDSSAKVVEIA
eukprot:g253.t1